MHGTVLHDDEWERGERVGQDSAGGGKGKRAGGGALGGDGIEPVRVEGLASLLAPAQALGSRELLAGCSAGALRRWATGPVGQPVGHLVSSIRVGQPAKVDARRVRQGR